MTGPVLRAAGAAARLAGLLVFPSFCRLCGRLLEGRGERVVCRACVGAIAPERAGRCEGCGEFFEGEAESHLCLRCMSGESPLALLRSAGRYRGALKDLVLLCKFRGQAVLADPLADLILRALADEPGLWDGVDGLVAVPLHARRRRERGFNQAERIARRIGRRRGLAVLRRALVRVRNVPPQSSLRASDREANVRGAFAVRKPERVRGRTLLLVDDVATTGATLRACARALRAAGAVEVRAVTAARA